MSNKPKAKLNTFKEYAHLKSKCLEHMTFLIIARWLYTPSEWILEHLGYIPALIYVVALALVCTYVVFAFLKNTYKTLQLELKFDFDLK